jgi:hypothetical protein
MIAFAADCLVFRMPSGEGIPFSSDMISVELLGGTAQWLDQELVEQATKAVFYYFKHELRRQTVSVGEFSEAIEKVLRGFALSVPAPPGGPELLESDLRLLARESAEGCELLFFPRLRDELRRHLRQSPRVLRFSGLRGCVKELAGTRRWTGRCRSLEEQIVQYLRECLNSERRDRECSLIIE